MSISFNDIVESIRIKNDTLKIKAFVTIGKDGEYYVAISPTLHVSGYGKTSEEAKMSFRENIEVFCDDLMALSNEKREHEIIKLGFSKVKFHNKDYSKSYVDENGILQGFEPGTIQTSMLEATI